MKPVFLVWLLLWLTGCALTPVAAKHLPSGEISVFSFSGRIAVRQGETRHHVKIDWQHAPTHDAILLTTFLGQGVAEIERDDAGARLLLADKRRFEADDWGTLAEQVFGFRLPLRASARWLLGEPTDAEGWRITVVERESSLPGALPSIIELEHDDISVRLRIDEWSEVR